MESNSYEILILTKHHNRTVKIENVTLDEAVSTAIVFFDKFSNFIGDMVLLAMTSYNDSKLHTAKMVRKIELKVGLKVEITVPENN